MPRPIQAIALDVSSRLALSQRQFEVLCSLLEQSGNPEQKAKELNAMPPDELRKLIGERKL